MTIASTARKRVTNVRKNAGKYQRNELTLLPMPEFTGIGTVYDQGQPMRIVISTYICLLLAGMQWLTPGEADSEQRGEQANNTKAQVIDLMISEQTMRFGNREGHVITTNETVPGPIIRLREGRDAVIKVTNRLNEDTSIHWHGILLPPGMDGVPGISFAGIKPGESFTYTFPVRQNGTYWYHSHSSLQEQSGLYGALIIEASKPEPFIYDRDQVIVLSDWTAENPMRVLEKLKMRSNYYNRQRRTIGDLFKDMATDGARPTLMDRLEWGSMRMDPTDIADVTGSTYTYLMNGCAPDSPWTALYQTGERIRMRFINAGAATYFDVRIPGLPMTVVSVDGQHVKPVSVDEIRIAIAETYDVVIEPKGSQAYTIFAEAMDRSGFACGTLATKPGMTAPLPPRRVRPILTMADMGMSHPTGMKGMHDASVTMPDVAMKGMDHAQHNAGSFPEIPGLSALKLAGTAGDEGPPATGFMHGPNHHGPANASIPMETKSRLDEPGIGLADTGTRVLRYSDLRSLIPNDDPRPPTREIELHITGNMERYIWGFDGKKFSEAEPIIFAFGERVRLTLVNDTMMNHPIHLHGMFMELDNGGGAHLPLKHTVNVKPAERLSLIITADELGNWAFHCHILYHMEMGMFRMVSVVEKVIGKP